MQTTIELADEHEMLQWGAVWAEALSPGIVVTLSGDLGAGKTTLVRGILRGLGYKDSVKSPTYTLVEPYDIGQHRIYHFDLYRIHDAEELEAMGIRDYFDGQSICLIEWPEKGRGMLPKADLWCNILLPEQGRGVIMEGYSGKGREVIRHATSYKS